MHDLIYIWYIPPPLHLGKHKWPLQNLFHPLHLGSGMSCLPMFPLPWQRLLSEGISSTTFSLMPTLVSLHQPSELKVPCRPPNAFQSSAYIRLAHSCILARVLLHTGACMSKCCDTYLFDTADRFKYIVLTIYTNDLQFREARLPLVIWSRFNKTRAPDMEQVQLSIFKLLNLARQVEREFILRYSWMLISGNGNGTSPNYIYKQTNIKNLWIWIFAKWIVKVCNAINASIHSNNFIPDLILC